MTRSVVRCLVAACLLSACTMITPEQAPDLAPTPDPAPTSMPAPVAVTTPTPAPTSVPTPVAEPGPAPAPLPPPDRINLDAETQAVIAHAKRTVFLIPFSHWDTDWHRDFSVYAAQADRNILDAIRIAKRHPRFRYTIEQVLFAQHFWETYPELRADLTALVRNRQFTFAWPGITQPETSLVSPAIQARNLQLGQDWLAHTFGVQARTAWQSDAFGNSAAFPIFLARSNIPYVYMGRGRGLSEQRRRGSLFPPAFYWASPADPTQRVLAAYVFYSDAWGPIYQLTDPAQQLVELRKIIDREYALTSSKYLFLPMGADISSPLPALPDLVERWNATSSDTVLVMADPETAFQYLATQPLPQYTTDLNPIWQAFYGTRPEAKIADKESEYYLTAADKFGLLLDAPPSTAWYTATVNAHYDNIAGVSYDSVWKASQQPRFEQAVATAAEDLSRTLAQIAGGVDTPLVVFNPTSWPRSEVVELAGGLPDERDLPQPVQRLGPDHVAIWADAVPAVGYRALAGAPTSTVAHPATATQMGQHMSLSNGLVSVVLDGAHGGTFSSLAAAGGPELLAGPGDDMVYFNDGGDVYGAFLGAERARASQASAQITILASGPLVARAQASFRLGDQPITKTVTLYANSPQIDVALEIAALPETTAVVQTPTTLSADVRTDDLGFAAFTHPIDNSPIVSGTITYRREVFYPITAWGDVSADGAGLTLISHGLQGLGGTSTLNLMLVRQVSDGGRPTSEGVTDRERHMLRYAYLPHTGTARAAQPWFVAYDFNQPLIPVWRVAEALRVQLPFMQNATPRQYAIDRAGRAFLPSLSLIAAESGIVADLYRSGDQVEAVVLDADPGTPVTISSGGQQRTLPPASFTVIPVEVAARGRCDIVPHDCRVLAGRARDAVR
ncbi:MAG: glycoside hydrolase family 38 C-terminal domain-containing protein [Roseiflexaceae bacterium]